MGLAEFFEKLGSGGQDFGRMLLDYELQKQRLAEQSRPNPLDDLRAQELMTRIALNQARLEGTLPNMRGGGGWGRGRGGDGKDSSNLNEIKKAMGITTSVTGNQIMPKANLSIWDRAVSGFADLFPFRGTPIQGVNYEPMKAQGRGTVLSQKKLLPLTIQEKVTNLDDPSLYR